MKVLSVEAPESTAQRYGTRIVHQDVDARVVAFRLQPGQVVPEHRSTSTVILHVVAGQGVFCGDGGEVALVPGGAVVYAPGEVHAIRASDEGVHFLAVIAPSPR